MEGAEALDFRVSLAHNTFIGLTVDDDFTITHLAISK